MISGHYHETHNVYGEQEEYDNKKKGGLNYLIMQAVQGEEIHIYKGGNLRDYVHVDDVVVLDSWKKKFMILSSVWKPVLSGHHRLCVKITGNKSKL